MTDLDRLDAPRPRELRIEQGPVVIVQTDDDPGDMGEPRIITENGATVVFVPSFTYWPAKPDGRTCGAYDDHDWTHTGSPSYCRGCGITFPVWQDVQRRAGMVPHDHRALGCEYPCDVVVGTLEPVR